MQRRSFIKNSTLCAIAIGTAGSIRFNGKKYVGDCETTTDILGPFYRPGSPVRTNLLVHDEKGPVILLSGKIKHNDCITPYAKAKIELWHCNVNGEYDNSSDDYKYRGTTYSDSNGNYSFTTILPVPYDAGDGTIRPAHYHLMITAEGYQPLITQLYFSGDKYISKDASAASPNAKRRILNVESLKDGSHKVSYDVSMSPKLLVENAVIDKLIGIYQANNDKAKAEFFKKDNMLWKKNDVYGVELEYIGDNTFQYPGIQRRKWIFHFELLSGGNINLTIIDIDENGKKIERSGKKIIS
jgi:catechol 1,2-dioxygenase